MVTVSRVPARSEAAAVDEARLVQATLEGDRNAYAELYRRHLHAAYARLTRLLGPVPERDDLLQQVFLDVYRALPRFRGEAKFSTFVHRIVINVAYEQLERRHRDRRRIAPLDEAQLDLLVAPGASPEARAAQRQELAQVFVHLAALRPKKRVAFVLVAVEGLSLEEASELVGASADTVKQRVLAARRELSTKLAKLVARGNAR